MATIVKTLPDAITDATGFPYITTYGILSNGGDIEPYLQAMETAGYTWTGAEVTAFDMFISSAKSCNGQNIWASIMELYPLFGDTMDHARIKLKKALADTTLTTLTQSGEYAFPQEEVVNSKVVGVLGVGGEIGGNPSQGAAGKWLDCGFLNEAVVTKATGFANQGSPNFGVTVVGDNQYTLEGNYPDPDTVYFNDIWGYREFDSSWHYNYGLRTKGNLYGMSLDTGAGTTDRFTRMAVDTSNGYTVGTTLGQSSNVQVSTTRSGDSTNPKDNLAQFLLMGHSRFNSGAASTPTKYATQRKNRVRWFMIDDGSISDGLAWAEFNVALDILLTALGKNNW